MRYGICLANLGTFSDPRVPVELGLAAEAHGWDGVFIWDHLAFVWGSAGGRSLDRPGRDRRVDDARAARHGGHARRTPPAPGRRAPGRDARQPERRPRHLRRRARRLDVGVRQVRRAGRREGASRDARRRARPAAQVLVRRGGHPPTASTTRSTASPLLRRRCRSGCRSGSGETDPRRCGAPHASTAGSPTAQTRPG